MGFSLQCSSFLHPGKDETMGGVRSWLRFLCNRLTRILPIHYLITAVLLFKYTSGITPKPMAFLCRCPDYLEHWVPSCTFLAPIPPPTVRRPSQVPYLSLKDIVQPKKKWGTLKGLLSCFNRKNLIKTFRAKKTWSPFLHDVRCRKTQKGAVTLCSHVTIRQMPPL